MASGDDIEKWIDAACDDAWDPAKDGWDFLELGDDQSAPPLLPDEFKTAHQNLAEWRSAVDFRQTVGALHKRCRSSEIFKNPRLNFLLDAWTLAEFVRHIPVDRIRLAQPTENWPDGQVRLGLQTANVEATIALTEGRKMADEYKPSSEKFTFDPVDNWVERAAGIPIALEQAIEKKLLKQYSSDFWLVVYLNINDGGIRQVEVERKIVAIKERYVKSFGGLFVIWKDKLF